MRWCDFFDAEGNVSLRVSGLRRSATPKYVRALLKRNGLPELVHAWVSQEDTRSSCWAICVFACPEDAAKALSVRTLVPERGNTQPFFTGPQPKYSLPSHVCESLLNIHFPLRWSSSSNLVLCEGEQQVVRICCKVFVDRNLVVCESDERRLGDFESNDIQQQVKIHMGTVFHRALMRLRIVFLEGGPELVLNPEYKGQSGEKDTKNV